MPRSSTRSSGSSCFSLLLAPSRSVSLGVLLGTFMGGMCLGSFWLPRVISPRHHPLRVYAVLELGIGILGILVVLGMPFIGSLAHDAGRTRALGNSPPGAILRDLSSASNDVDGGHAAGHRSLGGNHSARHLAAGLALWRQHSRGRARMPPRRDSYLLALLLYAGGAIHRRCSERRCSGNRLRIGPHHAARSGPKTRQLGSQPSPRRVPGQS